MNFEKLFLGEDIPEAKRRVARITNLLDWANRLIETDELIMAGDHANEAFVEISKLIDLNKEKRGKERLERLAGELTEIGIDPIKVLRDEYAHKQN